MVNHNPLGSPWDAYATLTQGNIDAAGMGRDEVSGSSSNSDTIEEASQAQFSDDEEVLIAEEVHVEPFVLPPWGPGPVAPIARAVPHQKSNIIESESDDDEPQHVSNTKQSTMWIELDSDEENDGRYLVKRRRRATNILKRGY